jgi:hypothetical protein
MVGDLHERIARLNQWSYGLRVRLALSKPELRQIETAGSQYEPAQERSNDDRCPSGSRRK